MSILFLSSLPQWYCLAANYTMKNAIKVIFPFAGFEFVSLNCHLFGWGFLYYKPRRAIFPCLCSLTLLLLIVYHVYSTSFLLEKMTFSNLFSEISLLGSSLCSLQFSKVCVERMILRQVIGNAYKNWLEICCFHQNKKKAFTLEQLSVKDTHPFILNLLTPEKKINRATFCHLKKCWKIFFISCSKYIISMFANKIKHSGMTQNSFLAFTWRYFWTILLG